MIRYHQAKTKKIELGFESKISGHIASHKMLSSVEEIQAVIDSLPNLENDRWPFLPKDIFSITKPITKEANPGFPDYLDTRIAKSQSGCFCPD